MEMRSLPAKYRRFSESLGRLSCAEAELISKSTQLCAVLMTGRVASYPTFSFINLYMATGLGSSFDTLAWRSAIATGPLFETLLNLSSGWRVRWHGRVKRISEVGKSILEGLGYRSTCNNIEGALGMRCCISSE